MLFRPHRATLEESMSAAVSVTSDIELIDCLETFYQFANKPFSLLIGEPVQELRCAWNSGLVSINGEAVGFLNRPSSITGQIMYPNPLYKLGNNDTFYVFVTKSEADLYHVVHVKFTGGGFSTRYLRGIFSSLRLAVAYADKLSLKDPNDSSCSSG